MDELQKNREVGQRIKEIRQQKKLSQEEFAKLCGFTSKSTISRIEKGERSVTLRNVSNIAKALGIDIFYLLEGKSYEEPAKNTYFADYQAIIDVLDSADGETIHQIRMIVDTFRKE